MLAIFYVYAPLFVYNYVELFNSGPREAENVGDNL